MIKNRPKKRAILKLPIQWISITLLTKRILDINTNRAQMVVTKELVWCPWKPLVHKANRNFRSHMRQISIIKSWARPVKYPPVTYSSQERLNITMIIIRNIKINITVTTNQWLERLNNNRTAKIIVTLNNKSKLLLRLQVHTILTRKYINSINVCVFPIKMLIIMNNILYLTYVFYSQDRGVKTANNHDKKR